MTEAPTPTTEKSKKQRDNTNNATKNFDYTTIADWLRTVSWGNDSHPAGVVKYYYAPFEGKIEKVPRDVRKAKSWKITTSSGKRIGLNM